MSLVPITYLAAHVDSKDDAEGGVAVAGAPEVAPVDWDDTMKVAREVNEEEEEAVVNTVGDAAAAGATTTVIRTVMVGVEEPNHSAANDQARQLPLRVFAVADNARYECDTKPITFRPTMMFQTRTHSFPLKNTSSARLDFGFSVEDPAGVSGVSGTNPGPFEIKPASGSIEAGETAMVTVRFSPEEVVNCARMLR
jgi:hydrocephalus-inducing protein